MSKNHIRVIGAKEHNLKNIDVDIPKGSLTVITGLSGSGKSSLAFDTIFAEGQRRYVESLSAYARQFLELMQKPDVESIDGLSPAISIEQKTTSKNPRSTVGTVTEIYDYMRLLWARVGIPYSPTSGKPITAQTITEMVDITLRSTEGARYYILSPIVRGRKGEYRKEIQELQKKGYQRLRVDGEIYDIEEVPALERNKKHDIDVVIDRIVIKGDIKQRLAESYETAVELSDGLAYLVSANDSKETVVFSNKFADVETGFTLPEIEPRLFSFNNPVGACPICDGLGHTMHFDEDLIIANPELPVVSAIAPAQNSSQNFYLKIIPQVLAHYGYSKSTIYKNLPERMKKILLYGSGTEELELMYEGFGYRGPKYLKKPFEGIIAYLSRFLGSESDIMRREAEQYQRSVDCRTCLGYRLNEAALCVKIDGKNIGELTKLSILDAKKWFDNVESTLNATQKEIARRILKEINERLGFLTHVGLGYLDMARLAGTLSGGESQRIRLASQIGSGLTGVLYVLDEPSIGLHQRDNDKLLETLERLRDLDNTVIVVEHDEDAMKMADYLIDMGPGAGINGGQIIARGTPEEVMNNSKSLTGQYLSGKMRIAIPKERRKGNGKTLSVKGIVGNNLKNVDVDIPLGTLCLVTGVSGSGKSTLVIDTVYALLNQKLNRGVTVPQKYDKVIGIEYLDKVVDIDQSPIGRTPRSNPATYTGVFSPIRDWFANLPESKARGYQAGRFSFNVKGGRCEVCQGDGVIKIEMHFLPDVYVTCDSCKGKRYNRETLEVTYKGKSIADILDMDVDEALEFFSVVPSISEKLRMLDRVGLGYIKVGQRSTTLSGGEAQRIKLAKELSRKATGSTIYILDEPTTGLHFQDVDKLIEVLQSLVDTGNTVVVIEHNLDVIKVADWVIDMGPEGGSSGGKIIATGTPEDIVKVAKSYTGKYLKKYLRK